MRSIHTATLFCILLGNITLPITLVFAQTSAATTHANNFLSAENTLQLESSSPSISSKLIAEIAANARMMQDLEELCDDIGPRLTGSQQLRQAQAWAMRKLIKYGATNVHKEAYDLGKPWVRGIARARLLNANGQALQIAQKGWTTASSGVVRGEVSLLNVKSLAEFKTAIPNLLGKVVLVESWPRATPIQAKNMTQYLQELNAAIVAAEFSFVLFKSEKEEPLFDMWGGPSDMIRNNEAIITKAHAQLLKRLILRGEKPRIEIEVGGGFGKKPVQAYNVVADFVGTENPEEMLILGAHQDSWDLSTGATDNGVGVVVAMEVLRAMHALDLKPKRSLRIVLFSGEEQGLLGSKAYVAAHRMELAKIQAVLVQDAGAGRIIGFSDMQVDKWYAALSPISAAAKEIAELDIFYGLDKGSDHESFFKQGIPAFAPIQESLDYRTHTQHSQVDSIDHVIKSNVIQSAQIMAIASWVLLNAEKIEHQKIVDSSK